MNVLDQIKSTKAKLDHVNVTIRYSSKEQQGIGEYFALREQYEAELVRLNDYVKEYATYFA